MSSLWMLVTVETVRWEYNVNKYGVRQDVGVYFGERKDFFQILNLYF